MTFEFKPGCEFCDKRGLPVMVGRYATAPAAAGAPQVDMVDADHKTPLPAPGGGLHYTRRLLRTGYLYVFDEKRNYWEAYFVTQDAYLMRFPLHACMATAYTPDLQPCSQTGHPEVAGMVTIVDPKNAGNVWFGFSDVEWTPAVLAAHADAGYRAKHMQKVDIQKALAHASQPYVYPIGKLGETIAEYACDPLKATAPNAFYDSPFPFHPRRLQLEQTLRAADYLRKDAGIVVGLYDPVGMARELAIRMSGRTQQFLKNPKRERQIATVSAIATIEQGVKAQTELQTIAGVERYADMIEQGPEAINPSNPALWGMPGSPELAEKWRARLTPQELNKAVASTWEEYKTKFNDNARSQWEKQYRAELSALDKTEIEPLALAHVAWMKSLRMANYFECNYDTKNIGTGLVYMQAVTQCIESTQDKKVCFDLYAEWLGKAQTTDARNLLVRGLAYNHDAIINAVKDVDAQALDKRAIPWDNILGVYKTAEESIAHGAADAMARLLAEIAGPVARVFGKALDGIGGTLVVALIGGATRCPMAKVSVSGSRTEFRKLLVRELLRRSGANLSPKQLDRAVLAEMNRLRIRNGRLPNGRVNRSWLVLLDPKAIANAATSATVAEKSKALAGAIRTIGQIEEEAWTTWRAISNVGVRFGVVAGLCQYVGLVKLMEDDEKAMSHEATESTWRLAAGRAALGGTFAEVVGTAIEKLPSVISRQGRGLLAGTSKVLLVGSRIAGIAAGVIMGAWDVSKTFEEYERGNKGLAFMYGLSAGLGFTITAGFALGWGAMIMFWLVAALVLVAIILELTKPNKLKEWLYRCYWGKGGEKYDSLETEKKQFELALKG